MSNTDLKYGQTSIALEYNESNFDILGTRAETPALTDAEIGERLAAPIDAAPLDDIVGPGESVLIVVPDATRQTACGQVVNLIVRRLIAGGTAPHDIRIIFATGIHRRVTEAERSSILTPFIAQRIKTLDHDPRDLSQLIRLGQTRSGLPIELNRALVEHDHVIIIGGVSFHYFAGFTGGRKLVCPGLASSRTISETHKLAFDCDIRDRRSGVDTGLLDGNAVHEAFQEIVEKINPVFAVNTIVNGAGDAVDLYCGNWKTSHRAACDAYAAANTIEIAERRDLVVVSCGGYPHDINLIQAHKVLEAASQACREGGQIIFLAECPDGLGRDDFLSWFDARDAKELADKLCKKYQVNGQTAWSLLCKAEKFDISMVSALDGLSLDKMRLGALDPAKLTTIVNRVDVKGYILPDGARTLIRGRAKI